jgi:LAO/AO transport system kinase
VCLTVAETGEGVDSLAENILAHKNFLCDSGKLAEKRARKKAAHIRGIIRGRLDARIEELLSSYSELNDEDSDPYSLSESIINQLDYSRV